MVTGLGPGHDKGKEYSKYILWLFLGGGALWFLIEGLQLITSFQQ